MRSLPWLDVLHVQSRPQPQFGLHRQEEVHAPARVMPAQVFARRPAKRIAVDDSKIKIGLPEVTLGLLPGGGGVTRAVRKFGLQTALVRGFQ